MATATFICQIIEEPWRGATRRRPALSAVPVGAGNIWNAEEIAPGVMLVVVDADQATLDAMAAVPNVKLVVDINTSADVPEVGRALAKDFDTRARERFSRRTR
jgi:hypothetical protein